MTATHTDEILARIDAALAETLPRTSLEILAALDFDPEHECEHSNHGIAQWHSGPAAYLIRAAGMTCARCGHQSETEDFALCKPAWERAGVVGLMCGVSTCTERVPRNAVWTIVGTL